MYHILTRGNNRRDVFKNGKDYRKYIEILQKYKEKYKFKLYHYALMRNHVHLVLEPVRDGGILSEIMKGINLSYAQYYKAKYKHVGHFWQDRYKSILVSKDRYLLACGSYVELNPVRAAIVKDPKEYRWSSYNAYAYGKTNPIVDEHPIHKRQSRGERSQRKEYRDFVMAMLRERNAMSGEMERRVVYGSDEFVKRLEKVHKIERVVKPRGRPRRGEEERK